MKKIKLILCLIMLLASAAPLLAVGPVADDRCEQALARCMISSWKALYDNIQAGFGDLFCIQGYAFCLIYL